MNLTVEVQSKKDLAAGKLLFEKYGEALKLRGVSKGQLEAVGVMEASTEQDKTGVVLLVRAFLMDNPEEPKEVFFLVQTTAQLYLTAGMTVAKCVRAFEPPNVQNKS